ncbi:MAG: aminotransferase class I/II-fold pyridoxal phosphate-dependent enzyme [Pseudobdellovibrionaceae bacterium]
MDHIDAELALLHKKGLLRRLQPVQGIDFASNDYLGLARNSEIKKRLIGYLEATDFIGATGSRLISGENEQTQATEEFLSHIFKVESSLVFGSGYLANVGVITALADDQTEIFSDQLNHASLIDGIRLSKAKSFIFSHNNLQHLQDLLAKSQALRKIVVIESVYSMDGDSPDLKSIIEICNQHDAFLIVDEAHATGVYGTQGLGMMEDLSYNIEKTIVIHTCGKALGCYGAFITSSQTVRNLMINKARSFIYSTALPPLILAQICLSFEYLLQNPDLRGQLSKNIDYAHRLFKAADINISGHHIAPILYPGNKQVLVAAEKLQHAGLNIKAIRSPTVREGSERLRVTFKSFHTQEQIRFFADQVVKVLQ